MARKIDTDANINRVRFSQQASHPPNPDSGYDYLYIISGSPHGGLYLKDSLGRQIGPFITGSTASVGVTYNEADPYGIHHRISGSHADDDEYSSNTLGNYTLVTPSGNVAWAVSNHVLSCVFSGQTISHVCAALRAITLADGEWFETTFHLLHNTSNSFGVIGLIVTNGATTTSNGLSCFVFADTANSRTTIEINTGALNSHGTGAQGKNINPNSILGRLRIRLKRNSSTSFSYMVSTDDGAQWSDLGASGVNPGFTPTHAGFIVSSWGGSEVGIASFDYIRHF